MTSSPRVLMLTSEWPTAQQPYHAPYLVQQVEFLRRAGVEVDVFPFRGARNPFNYLKAWLRLRGALKKAPYQLLHAQFGQSALLTIPRRLPLVVTFHGCDLQGVKRADGTMSWGGRFLQALCQLVARRANAVILVSERMRNFIAPGVTASVIPTGLDFDQIPVVPKAEARHRLGLPESEPLVLFVGNPHETVKRHCLAHAAVQVLQATYPARLIVGWGVLRPQILLLMNACDVLLMTSIQEGSPCVVKEALACNLPIVSLDVGDVPVRVKGLPGCEICADDRPETIAASLERVLRRADRTPGRAAVLDLDERLLAARIADIYRDVLATVQGGHAMSPDPSRLPRPD